MSLFNNPDLYPTPSDVIDRMLEGIQLEGKTVLEPHAGTGNLVKALQSLGADVIACEISPQLVKIVQDHCPIIGRDFLELTSDKISHIDLIVMNPPFSQGAAHILHAYKIAPDGCKIIALCNYETLKNTYSKSREELKTLIDTYGQFENLGDCFSTSERKTGVEVALIRLDKPGGKENTEFEGFFMDEDPTEEQANGLISYNIVRDLVQRYVQSIKIFDEQLETAIRLNEMRKDYFDNDYELSDRQRNPGTISISITQDGAPLARNQFKKQMQKAGWRWIFDKMNMKKHTTRGLKEEINKFVETQENIPFTMKNIYHMLDMVVQTRGQRMDKAILEVFDKVTAHHADNRHNLEGWKTNSHYLLTEKFIMPNVVQSDWGSGLRTNYHGWAEPIEDMVKALCYLTGMNYDETTPLNDFLKNNNCKYGEWYSWGFLEIKCFKKGTTHFKFQNQDLWAQFNQRVAKLKGYPLPEKKEQTKYQERQNGRKPAKAAYKPVAQKPTVLATFNF